MGVKTPVRLAVRLVLPFMSLLPARGQLRRPQPRSLRRRLEAHHRTASGAWEAGKGKRRAECLPADAFPDPGRVRLAQKQADALALSGSYPSASPAIDAALRPIAGIPCVNQFLTDSSVY